MNGKASELYSWGLPKLKSETRDLLKKMNFKIFIKVFYDPVGKRTWNQIDDGLDSEAPFRTLG